MIIDGSHISHESHRHPLHFVDDTTVRFTCDGCDQIGIGKRYTCVECNFDLHKHCGVDPNTPLFHPLRPKCHNIKFCLRPPAHATHYCDACTKPVTGFLYRCERCNFDLHPCCAKLPLVLEVGGGEVKMKLIEKDRRWVYRSRCKKYKLEVAYAREIIEERSSELLRSEMGIVGETSLSRRGRLRRYSEMIGMALKILISALLGDPTSLIVAVVASLMRSS